ncbi:TRAP transporter substrate-binding protein [Phreatobacter sp. AB_2022a]|uniref:TRAP transporter substrate-binding protein n=1 Tax=Phreatobacter sp. AB_2022a TaxID=3003134 RepID=UPI0022873752|nr:TRAP transporter substrate-binding protein [Phreatobacter sp. AB_2022a]MCZ0735088.1 TRAP transporter substrate-binding protein [Phreatobacter sp. AB_2022a]
MTGHSITRRVAARLIAAPFVLAAGRARAEPLNLDLVNEYPATSLPGEADSFFAAMVARELAGKLNVRPISDARSGLNARQQFSAVSLGTFAMANTLGGALSQFRPALALAALPFQTPTVAAARRLFDLAAPRYAEIFGQLNHRLLFVSPWPASGLWTARPVAGPRDLEQLRVRTYDATGTAVFGRLSAHAEVVSFADLEPRLTDGSIDAVLSSGDGGAGRQLWRRLPHFAAINYAVPLSFGTINLDLWNGFDTETRARLEAIGQATTERQWAAMTGRVEQNYGTMRQNGMTIVDPVPAPLVGALQAAAMPAVQAWMETAGAEDRIILTRYKELAPAR